MDDLKKKTLKFNKTISNFPYKKSLVLVILFIVSVLSFKKCTAKAYHYLNGSYDRQSAQLSSVVNSVIGIPYHQEPQYRNDALGIPRLTKEQWFALPYYDSALEVDLVEDKLGLVASMPTKEEATHAQSIAINPVFPFRAMRPNNLIYNKLCDHFLTCEVLTISVHDFALANLDILKNIIKIAERPCDYIKTVDEIKPVDEIVYLSSKGFRGNVFYPYVLRPSDVKEGIEAARKKLGCDRKNFFDSIPSLRYHSSITSRKFVLIIVNKSGIVFKDGKKNVEKSFDIIVERQDIK
jgi:hypothetical protein